jgi:glucose uptake protein GlcU
VLTSYNWVVWSTIIIQALGGIVSAFYVSHAQKDARSLNCNMPVSLVHNVRVENSDLEQRLGSVNKARDVRLKVWSTIIIQALGGIVSAFYVSHAQKDARSLATTASPGRTVICQLVLFIMFVWRTAI